MAKTAGKEGLAEEIINVRTKEGKKTTIKASTLKSLNDAGYPHGLTVLPKELVVE